MDICVDYFSIILLYGYVYRLYRYTCICILTVNINTSLQFLLN